MSKEQFELGLRIIERAIRSALEARGVRDFSFDQQKQGSGPRETTFSVTAQGKTGQALFTREEIEDSASSQRIDPIARSKVRGLIATVAN